MTDSTTDPDVVTQSMVRTLWDQALGAPGEMASIHECAAALLGRANAQALS